MVYFRRRAFSPVLQYSLKSVSRFWLRQRIYPAHHVVLYQCVQFIMTRILIIEGNAEERELFTLILQEAGYDVHGAPDGNAGIELCQQQPYHLVISDLYMPNKEGLETILELKTDFPELKIIAITGGTTWVHSRGTQNFDDILSIAKAVGADATLTKSILKQMLLDVVRKILCEE